MSRYQKKKRTKDERRKPKKKKQNRFSKYGRFHLEFDLEFWVLFQIPPSTKRLIEFQWNAVKSGCYLFSSFYSTVWCSLCSVLVLSVALLQSSSTFQNSPKKKKRTYTQRGSISSSNWTETIVRIDCGDELTSLTHSSVRNDNFQKTKRKKEKKNNKKNKKQKTIKHARFHGGLQRNTCIYFKRSPSTACALRAQWYWVGFGYSWENISSVSKTGLRAFVYGDRRSTWRRTHAISFTYIHFVRIRQLGVIVSVSVAHHSPIFGAEWWCWCFFAARSIEANASFKRWHIK